MCPQKLPTECTWQQHVGSCERWGRAVDRRAKPSLSPRCLGRSRVLASDPSQLAATKEKLIDYADLDIQGRNSSKRSPFDRAGSRKEEWESCPAPCSLHACIAAD